MKHTLFLLSVLIAFYSCKQTEKKTNESKPQTYNSNFLLPSKVEATYLLKIKNEEKTDWIKSIIDNNLLSEITDIAIESQGKCYFYQSNDLMTKNDILTQMGVDTLKIQSYKKQKNEIDGFHFKENWFFDINKQQFIKDVEVYSIYRVYKKELPYMATPKFVKKILFSVHKQNSKTDNMKLVAKNVKSALLFSSSLPSNTIYGLDTTKLKKYFFNIAFDSTKTVYNFDNPKEKIYRDDYKKYFGAETIKTTILDDDDTSIDTTYTTKPDYSYVSGIAFVEDWYLNKSTMELTKKVKYIGPVCDIEEDIQDTTLIIRKIPFVVKLK